ncbi:MAG TPA: hydroxysqualene dehydroxylase HpnE [Bryobacteraceae bacterium]|nr:hydroxysqualene dehydroxylase HpnE [Bryobacteraceae bacterium]
MLPDVIVAGGGLAGLSAAAALGAAGYRVQLLESRPFLGGRATSYEMGGETIDNCQHILLRCCVNLLDFYRRMGVQHDITFHREFIILEPGGRPSSLRAGKLPAPLHFSGSFLTLRFLNLSEKLALMRGMLAIQREHSTRADLDRISMQQWLEEKRQPKRLIDRFWRPVLVSAISEELDRMAAAHGFQFFWLAFLARSDSYEMGIPNVPLARLYSSDLWKHIGSVEVLTRTPVERFLIEGAQVRAVEAGGKEWQAGHYISALPFDRAAALGVPVDIEGFEYSPITGIHLWFDRSITGIPQAALLDRTIQWIFNKDSGRYVQLVVSASRSLLDMPRADVIALAVDELAEFFPAVRRAKLVKSHVVKEVRAVFSAKPGLGSRRPPTQTGIENLFLAGDWTRSGWPATMEGAVRSGYLAAEAVTAAAGTPQKFLLPDLE